jgi:hypothetical protein
MIDSLGDVGSALNRGDPAKLYELYEALRLELRNDADARAVDVTVHPEGRGSTRVRGGTPTRPCGIPAQCRYPCEETTRLGMPVVLAA